MADIAIERLTVTIPGWSGESAERLARLIAQRLGSAATDVTRQGQHQSMGVNLPATGSEQADQLAAQVVDDLVRQLNRSF